MSDDFRRELYEERAEWANLESDIADARQYTRVGGLIWRIYNWIERRAQRGRAEAQAEIDALNESEGR